MASNDWFSEAAKEVSETPAAIWARREREFAEKQEKRSFIDQAVRDLAAAEAARIFEAVARGEALYTGGPTKIRKTVYKVPGGSASGGYTPEGGLSVFKPAHNSNSTTRSPAISPQQGLNAILNAVRHAGDGMGDDDKDAEMFKVAGEWITKITNGITGVLKESEDT